MQRRGLTRRPPGGAAQDRYSRLIEQALGDFFGTAEGNEQVFGRGWTPAVDIAETEHGLIFYAELPGLSKEDVDVTLENSVLTLRGERRFERDVKEENFHRIERSYGSFSRSFTLPNNVKQEACQASFQDGVLRIEIPKAEEAKPRKISIG